ncbi:lytic polysaccharide monooxygenase [Hyaloscypha hepaticicola]|uniref:Lytic polysaccharide monooxygenase n=1 Tax=Hyaloscypha hepaticicola TaxID=2082293 RepID=A0A2J6PL84_9HELO|nr:lytic polysaccharide monooxygenase [Hyaloscypha hepaticicola]
MPPNEGPVTSVTSEDLRYNLRRKTGVVGACPVSAGGNMTVGMHAQIGDRSFANQAIGGNCYGPVPRLHAKGYLEQQVRQQKFHHSCIYRPRSYLVPVEAIALHTPQTVGGAQF